MLQYGGENPPRVRRREASTRTKIQVKLLGTKKPPCRMIHSVVSLHHFTFFVSWGSIASCGRHSPELKGNHDNCGNNV